MSNRSLLFLILFVLVIFFVVKFDMTTQGKIGVTNLIYGDEMRGLKGMRVVVEPLIPELEKDGLRREEVLKELAAKVERSGIKILPEEEWQRTPGKPVLNATIEAVKLDKQNYQYTVEIEVTKSETGGRVSGSEKIKTIWSTSEIGEGNVNDIRKKFDEITSVFLKARSGS
ncbi:MAG: hypothetical protein WCJ37_14385 [Syntrophus sp. (in: bacteria)]